MNKLKDLSIDKLKEFIEIKMNTIKPLGQFYHNSITFYKENNLDRNIIYSINDIRKVLITKERDEKISNIVDGKES